MDPKVATKDNTEREDEEVERLQRRLPKDKPPRHDSHKQRISPESDPDTESDPDMSLNRREVGGSILSRILLRYAQGDSGKVTVRNTESDKIVQVNPETVEENPGKYQEVEDQDSPQEDSESDLTLAIRERVNSDPAFAGMVKGLNDPRGLGSIDDDRPLPAALAKAFPGLKTFGEAREEVAKAIKPKAPAKKPGPAKLLNPPKPHKIHPPRPPVKPRPAKPAPPDVPNKDRPDPDAPRDEYDGKPQETQLPPSKRLVDYNEKLKPEDAPSPGPKPSPSSEEPSESPPIKGETPTSKQDPGKGKAPKAPSEVEVWIQEGKHLEPEFQKYLDNNPQNARGASGEVEVWNPVSKQRVPFSKLPPEQQKKLQASFQQEKETLAQQEQEARNAEETAKEHQAALKALEDSPEVLKLIHQLSDPKSNASQKLKGKDLPSLVPEKIFPELKGAPDVWALKSLDRLVGLAESVKDSLAIRPELKGFQKEMAKDTKGVKAFFKKDPVLTNLEDPATAIQGMKAKEVEEVKKRYDAFKKAEERTKHVLKQAKKPKTAKLLRGLLDPESPIAKKAASSPEADASLIGLEGFKEGTKVSDLVATAKELYAIPPPPQRPEPTLQEVLDSVSLLDKTFPKKTARSLYGLHPEEINAVVAAYKGAKAKGDDLPEAMLKSGQYEPNPSKVLPPITVSYKGEPTPFSELPPKEQSKAYAQHKAMVVGASLRARNILASNYQAEGIPPGAATLLASFRLHEPPGESEEERLDRATQKEAKVLKYAVKKNLPPFKNPKEAFTLFTRGDSKDPATHRLAVAYAKGADYAALVKSHLSRQAEDPPSEHDTPGQLVGKMQKLGEAVDERAKYYPEEDRSTFQKIKGDLRAYFMERLSGLAPKKAKEVEGELEKSASKDWAKGMLPEKPSLSGQKSWFSSFLKIACSLGTSKVTTKTSHYRGIEPGSVTPYPTWHPADRVTEADGKRILAEARKNVNLKIEGRIPDTAYREALDHAIHSLDDGKFSKGLHPTVYNSLLAKLAGEAPLPSTLLTVTAMTNKKVASSLRTLAASLVETAPTAAFSIVEMADTLEKQAQQEQEGQGEQKQAQQEQQGQSEQKEAAQKYDSLRSMVIRTAYEAKDRAPFKTLLAAVRLSPFFLQRDTRTWHLSSSQSNKQSWL